MEGKPQKGTRTGFTTGACSAAAARACAVGLVHGLIPPHITSLLPNGDRVSFAVGDGVVEGEGAQRRAHAWVEKFAGDDPDCTDKAHLTVDLRVLPGQVGKIVYRSGEGVGTVTMPGLGLEVGGPAINPVPRQNIADNLREALDEHGSDLLNHHGLEVTISVPGGQDMAKKTTMMKRIGRGKSAIGAGVPGLWIGGWGKAERRRPRARTGPTIRRTPPAIPVPHQIGQAILRASLRPWQARGDSPPP